VKKWIHSCLVAALMVVSGLANSAPPPKKTAAKDGKQLSIYTKAPLTTKQKLDVLKAFSKTLGGLETPVKLSPRALASEYAMLIINNARGVNAYSDLITLEPLAGGQSQEILVRLKPRVVGKPILIDASVSGKGRISASNSHQSSDGHQSLTLTKTTPSGHLLYAILPKTLDWQSIRISADTGARFDVQSIEITPTN
jgi:hypothetical protein